MILNNRLRESGRSFNDAKTQLKGLYFKMLNNQEQLDQFVNTRNDKGLIEFVCFWNADFYRALLDGITSIYKFFSTWPSYKIRHTTQRRDA